MSNKQPLSHLIDLTDLPEEINWLSNSISSFFNSLYLGYYRRHHDYGLNSSYIDFSISTSNLLKFDVPGTGLSLILNPSLDPNSGVSTTEIPFNCSIDYGYWESKAL